MIVIVDYRKFHWVYIPPSYGSIAPIVVTTLSTFSLATIESTGSPAILFYPYESMFVCVSVSLFVLKPNALGGGTFTDDQFLLNKTAKT